jgi:hypothetical protein
MAESSDRLKIISEVLTIVTPGVSQVLKNSDRLVWSISIFSEDSNTLPMYIGNDGNDTVDATNGWKVFPAGVIDFNSNEFFSAYTLQIPLRSIYIYSDEAATYRLLYSINNG